MEICLKGRQLGEVSRCGHSIKLRHIGITTTMLRRDQQRQDGNISGNSSPLRPVSEKSQIPQFIPILYYIARLYYEMEHCFSQLSCDSEFPGTPNNVQKPGPLSYFKEHGMILHILPNLRTIICGLMTTKKETVYSRQWFTTCLRTEINPRSLKFHMHGPLSSQVEP